MNKEDVAVAVKKAVEEAITPPTPAKDIEDAVANGIVKATETLRKERKERWATKKEKWSNKKKEIKKEWTKKKAEIKVKLQEKKKEIKKTIKKIEKKIEKKLKVDRKRRQEKVDKIVKDAKKWWDKKVKSKKWAQKAEKRFEEASEDMKQIRTKMDKKNATFKTKVSDWLSENGFEEFSGAKMLTAGATLFALSALM